MHPDSEVYVLDLILHAHIYLPDNPVANNRPNSPPQSGALNSNHHGSTGPPVPQRNYERPNRLRNHNQKDLGPLLNPMELSQSNNLGSRYNTPPVASRRSATNIALTDHVNFAPSLDTSTNHYETIPGLKQQPFILASGQCNYPLPKAANHTYPIPPPSENPYEVAMASSWMGDKCVTGPPAALTEETCIKNEPKPQKTEDSHDIHVPLSRENPYEFN